MQNDKRTDGLDISRIRVSSITAVSYIEPRNIGLFNSRRCFGIFYKLEGSSECRIGGESHVFDRDHIVILPKDSTYQIYPRVFGKTVMVEFLCAGDFSYNPSRVYSWKLSNPEILGRLFCEIERIWTFKKTAFYNRCFSLLYQIFAELEREGAGYYMNSARYERIRAAQRYLEEHYNNPALSIAELAGIAGMSPSYFRRLYAQVYKYSPKQYITTVRIEKAKDLLVAGSYTVGEISEMVGYSSVYYFSGTFKGLTGYTPSEYASSYIKR